MKLSQEEAYRLLKWQFEMGVTQLVGDRKSIPQKPSLQTCNTLKKIKHYIEQIPQFTLKQYAKHTHIGEGSTHPTVMILLDHPKRKDDMAGKMWSPVIKLLAQSIAYGLGLSFDKIFTGFSLFWPPLGDAQTIGGDVILCVPVVNQLITVLKPHVLIVMSPLWVQYGLSSWNASKSTSLLHLHGTRISLGTTQVMMGFSPEDLFKNADLRPLFWKDLQGITREL